MGINWLTELKNANQILCRAGAVQNDTYCSHAPQNGKTHLKGGTRIGENNGRQSFNGENHKLFRFKRTKDQLRAEREKKSSKMTRFVHFHEKGEREERGDRRI